ncbi:MAG: dihydroneopterin aldolase [Lentisphaeria bacterium]|nr:dihydroneopterin aldolase [Lentisphaeria bacterium]
MNDHIIIEDLLLRCIVGINPEERVKEQDVVLNISLHADLHQAAQTDDIADTIDYKKLKVEIRGFVEASSFFLIEKLASEVARICLKRPQVERVIVRLDKPGALRFARSVAVEIDRCREDFAT